MKRYLDKIKMKALPNRLYYGTEKKRGHIHNEDKISAYSVVWREVLQWGLEVQAIV